MPIVDDDDEEAPKAKVSRKDTNQYMREWYAKNKVRLKKRKLEKEKAERAGRKLPRGPGVGRPQTKGKHDAKRRGRPKALNPKSRRVYFLEIDDENQTAWLRMQNGGYWWYWYGSEYEAQGYYLKLLARVKPKSKQASGLVKYLINNRKHSTYWNSTRDTAICVEAIGILMELRI